MSGMIEVPYARSAPYDNSAYISRMSDLMARQAEANAAAIRQGGQIRAAGWNNYGNLAMTTLADLAKSRDYQRELEMKERTRIEALRQRAEDVALRNREFDERKAERVDAEQWRQRQDFNTRADHMTDNLAPNATISPAIYDARVLGSDSEQRYAHDPAMDARLPARPISEGLPMPGYAGVLPNATPDGYAPPPGGAPRQMSNATPDAAQQDFADPMGRTMSPDVAARPEQYRRLPNFAEKNAADTLESQRQARLAAQQNTIEDNRRLAEAARATAEYRNARLRQGGANQNRGQVFQGPNGPVLVNPRTGTTQPILDGDGTPMKPVGGLPPQVATRVDSKTKAFDANPIVKRVATQAEAVQFANGLDPNTKNPADDQGLIYAFAKAMDPDSVVREGEYATVQKYAQSWAQSFGFNALRVFSNSEFLTPQARANMRATITQKFNAGRGQYENLRKEYGRQISTIIGNDTGADYLTDYGSAFPADASGPDMKDVAEGKARTFRNGPHKGETWAVHNGVAEKVK